MTRLKKEISISLCQLFCLTFCLIYLVCLCLWTIIGRIARPTNSGITSKPGVDGDVVSGASIIWLAEFAKFRILEGTPMDLSESFTLCSKII